MALLMYIANAFPWPLAAKSTMLWYFYFKKNPHIAVHVNVKCYISYQFTKYACNFVCPFYDISQIAKLGKLTETML